MLSSSLLHAWLRAPLLCTVFTALLLSPRSGRTVTFKRTFRAFTEDHDVAAPLLASARPRTHTSRTDNTYERPCATPAARKWDYCNATLSTDERTSSLLEALTTEEKIALLGNGVPAIARLSLPPYNWWNEALHGVSSTCCPPVRFESTSFPQVCSLGPSFNRSLYESIGDAVGAEATEHFWAADDVPGLTFWTPNVNLFRDPRWGRGQEVPGEDPYLNGEYAAALIPALQFGRQRQRGDDGRGDKPRPRIAAACKHFAAYSIETGRMAFDAKVTKRDMDDSYLPMFKRCVEAGVLGFMCSYNAVNGVPSCANAELLTSKLREEWGFDGYVTSDCGAVANVFAAHKYVDSIEGAIGAALKAGVDTNCGTTIQSKGLSALKGGKMSMADVDRALKNLFGVQFRLGYYDGPPLTSGPAVGSKGQSQSLRRRRLALLEERVHMHNELALDAARQGVVLLKNGHGEQGTGRDSLRPPLPLSEDQHRSIALFGPNADAGGTMLGNYHGIAPVLISPKQGLEDMGVDVTYYRGCNISSTHGDSDDPHPDAMCHAAASSDATVLVMGLDQSIESEGTDRTSLTLPGTAQDELISFASGCAKRRGNDAPPVVLVIMAGGPVDLTPYKESGSVDAILYVGYPGQAGGAAIAEALFGKFSPSGRLTTTVYPARFVDQVAPGDMRMRPNEDDGFPGRTHRFYTGEVVYPFGYGLSYASLESEILEERRESKNNSAGSVVVEVRNRGPVDSAHSILLFQSGPNAGRDGNPLKTLVGFEKIFVKVGGTRRLEIAVDPEQVSSAPGLHSYSLG